MFIYKYSAKEQEEIRKIRQKYMSPEEDGMTRLRNLDAKAGSKATMIALIFGISGTLIMGTGMSLILTDLAELLHMTSIGGMVLGVITGVIGIILVIVAYPLYQKVLKREREKIAPEILKLTEELMK